MLDALISVVQQLRMRQLLRRWHKRFAVRILLVDSYEFFDRTLRRRRRSATGIGFPDRQVIASSNCKGCADASSSSCSGPESRFRLEPCCPRASPLRRFGVAVEPIAHGFCSVKMTDSLFAVLSETM